MAFITSHSDDDFASGVSFYEMPESFRDLSAYRLSMMDFTFPSSSNSLMNNWCSLRGGFARNGIILLSPVMDVHSPWSATTGENSVVT